MSRLTDPAGWPDEWTASLTGSTPSRSPAPSSAALYRHPEDQVGSVEVIRTLRVTRASAVKARTQTFNTLWDVMIGAPSPLRDELVDLTKRTLVNRCLRLRPGTDYLLSLVDHPDRLLLAAVKTSLLDLARRWKALDVHTSDRPQLQGTSPRAPG